MNKLFRKTRSKRRAPDCIVFKSKESLSIHLMQNIRESVNHLLKPQYGKEIPIFFMEDGLDIAFVGKDFNWVASDTMELKELCVK